MTAVKKYRVTVRVVPRSADARVFDVRKVEVEATVAHDADRRAEAIVRADHRDARAVVAINRKRVAQ